MKRLIIIFLLLMAVSLPGPVLAYTETFYVCNGGDGTLPETATCATAYDEADFNTAGNWDTDDQDDGKIGLNDIVYFLDEGGTFTFSLQPQQSGSSGNPITLKNYVGDSPVIESIIHNSKTYIIIDGLDIRDGMSIGTNWTIKNTKVQYWRP